MLSDEGVKKRLKHTVKIIIAIMILGFSYYFIVINTDFYIPCIFKLITGLDCPGCGISHLCMNLIQAGMNLGKPDKCWMYIKLAAKSNPFIMLNLPILSGLVLHNTATWIKTGGIKPKKLEDFLIVFEIIGMIIWFIVRNFYIKG